MEPDDLERAVHELIARRGGGWRQVPLPDDLLLAAGGLGLDSIALVELLLECEQRFGMNGTAGLLAGPPLTVGRLVARVEACRRC